MKLLLIEGVPGSGKTTSAEAIHDICAASGLSVRWYREEFVDHPIKPSHLRKASAATNFEDRCLEAWTRFALAAEQTDRLYIIEGSAFQSTVRIMMELDYPIGSIRDYYDAFERIVAPLDPGVVYFRQQHFDEFFRQTMRSRDEIFRERIPRYLAETPYCKNRQLSGLTGMFTFWRNYRDLCDELVQHANIPCCVIENSARDWDAHMREALDFVSSRGVKLRAPNRFSISPRPYCQPELRT